MKNTVLFILIFNLFPMFVFAQYSVSGRKVLGWTAMGIGGAVWGGREALHADPYCFEKKFGVSEYSFFGSKQWERKYEGNRYMNDGGYPNKMKSQLLGNFGRDYWHTSKYITFTIGGAFLIDRGSSKQKWHHKALDVLIGSVIFSISSNVTYNLLTK